MPRGKKGLKIDLIGLMVTVALDLRTKLKSLLTIQEPNHIKFEKGGPDEELTLLLILLPIGS